MTADESGAPAGTDVAGPESAALYQRALQVLPGGVNSPVRAFRKVGGTPFFAERAAGARLHDVDGREYVDYIMSWGALMLGHAHPAIVEGVERAAARGTSYGVPCPAEVALAELVTDLVPSVEVVRVVNSGTEATMSALRLARAATGRDRLLKFAGCYHGHGDSFLVQAGSGVATLGLPDSPGVPSVLAELTVTVPYNDLEGAAEVFRRFSSELAAVIVEPICGNAGFIPPVPGFLEGLRTLCSQYGALLIFDEVMTGFRVGLHGAQGRFGVEPDLTTLGKVIGGGLPVGAYGGRRDLMARVAPAGPVYQAGTLSGNPLAMAAGIAQLQVLRETDPYASLEARARRLVDGMAALAAARDVPFWGDVAGAMFGWFFRDGPIHDFEEARQADADLFGRFFHGCLRRGVFLAPSPFEAAFLSTAHTDADIDHTLDIMAAALEEALS